MPDLTAIYQSMRGSDLNQRVGGGDPEQVGQFCMHSLQQNLQFQPEDRVLDFGCGIGRVVVQAAAQLGFAGPQFIGMDIMPDVIAFCRSTIAPVFLNTAFELIEGSNVHYNKYGKAADAFSRAQVVGKYGRSFTKAYAFSVFTHVDLADFSGLLGFVGQLLQPNGEFLFTCFILTEYSRAAIRNGGTKFGFDNPAYEHDDTVFIGTGADRLAFIAFDIALIEKLVFTAGLVIARVEYGGWRGSGFESSLQDIVVVRKAG